MNPKKLFKNNKLLIFVAIAIVLFVTIALLNTRQDLRQRAADNQTITKIVFNPQKIETKIGSKPTDMSVLAYDANNEPVFNGVTYSWGISSMNTVGTLTMHTGAVSTFVPQNLGSGDIYVTATNDSGSFTGSIRVIVYAIDTTPSPSPPSNNRYGYALSFTESLGQYLTIPNGNDTTLSQDGFTVDFWFNKMNNSRNTHHLFDAENLMLLLNSDSVNFNRVLIQTGLGGSELEFIMGPSVSSNTWHHVGVTYKPTSNTRGSMALHLDGNTITDTDVPSPFTTNNMNGWLIGATEFVGAIDELHIRRGVHFSQNASTYPIPTSPYTLETSTILLAHFDASYQDLSGTHEIKPGSNNSFIASSIPELSITPSIPQRKNGDVNGDNFVNITDLSMLLSNWQSTTYANADFNKNGRVEITDLSILLSNWGS